MLQWTHAAVVMLLICLLEKCPCVLFLKAINHVLCEVGKRCYGWSRVYVRCGRCILTIWFHKLMENWPHTDNRGEETQINKYVQGPHNIHLELHTVSHYLHGLQAMF